MNPNNNNSFPNVPVSINGQPIPENVVNTFRAFVNSASSTIRRSSTDQDSTGHANTGIGNNGLAAGMQALSSAASLIPNSTSIPMNSTESSRQSNSTQVENTSFTENLSRNESPEQSSNYGDPNTQNNDGIQNQATVQQGINTRELIQNLSPLLINVFRVFIVLFGKHVSGYLMNVALVALLGFGYFRSEETVKRLAYSDSLLGSRNVRSLFNSIVITLFGIGVTIWLYIPGDILWLCAFYVNPESFTFGNFITTITTVLMLNFFIKCWIVAFKLFLCILMHFLPNLLAVMPNLLNCVDVFGYLYLSSVVISFWFVYIIRDDGNYGVGIAIFVAYASSRLPHFLTVIKDCILTFMKVFSCRTYGRKSTSAEITDASRCTICLPLEGFRMPTTMVCGHVFCHSCISRWLLEKTSCPICRTEIIAKDDINLNSARNIFFM